MVGGGKVGQNNREGEKRKRPSARRRNGLMALHPWVICGGEALYFITG